MRNLRKHSLVALGLLILLACSSLTVRKALAGGDDSNSNFEFVGQVVALPSGGSLVGDWTVGRRTIHVTASTVINQEDGRLAVGATVEVKGVPRTDGSVDATKIEVKIAPSASPSPTPSPSPGCHDFEGQIQSLPNTTGFAGDWTVDNRIVHVASSTIIKTENGATVALGAQVEIEGCMAQDGSINATKIEVKKIASPAGDPCFSFFGTIGSLPNTQGFTGDWTVGQRTIHVTSNTVIKTEQGTVAVGAPVEVKGCVQADGSINASRIEVKRAGEDNPPNALFEFFGTVQLLPVAQGFIGDWTVNGRTVHVTNTTRIEREFRPLVVGSFVEIKGTLQPDNSINAAKIEVERSNDTGRRINFFELFGDVKALPAGPGFVGNWTVGNSIVHVSQATEVEQEAERPLALGARVVVVGTQRTDSSLDAVKIRTLKSVDSSSSFVSQNYNDFLNREAEQDGLSYWTGQVESCGNDQKCLNQRRIDVSAAFFISKEFQQTGYFVYRYYQASLGRVPTFTEFTPDVRSVSKNAGAGETALEADKKAFGDAWVAHPAFTSIYDDKSNAEFVDVLFANAGVTPGAGERESLISGLNTGAETRSSALRRIVENETFFRQDYNRAFVMMQYFGYLRRDADQGGLDFWYNVLNNREPDNFKGMVCSFITSAEYQKRFSSSATHSNAECQ